MWKREYCYKYELKSKLEMLFSLAPVPNLLPLYYWVFQKINYLLLVPFSPIIFLLLASSHSTSPISQQDHYSLLMSIISEQFLVLLFLGLSGRPFINFSPKILDSFGFWSAHSLLVFLYYVFSAFLWPPLPLRRNT